MPATGNNRSGGSGSGRGAQDFIAALDRLAGQFPSGWFGGARFVLTAGEQFAFIRLQDLWSPLRFLRQMAGNPPVQFGTAGFQPHLVDDRNPARHYTAFLFLGFWLPYPLGVVGLWLWELAGLVRYRYWAQHDITMGYIGLRHGRQVRRQGPGVLAGLAARDVAVAPGHQAE